MITVIGGVKGGSGKSTLSTNLAVLRASTKKKVLLIDADEQKTTSDWANAREMLGIPTNWTTIQLSGAAVRAQVQKLKDHYDDIIIDVGGRDTTSQRSALTVANNFVVPFQPSSADVWTLSSVNALISEILSVNENLISFAVINRGEPQGEDNNEAIEILSECSVFKCPPLVIGQRKIFKKSLSDGMAVIEMKPIDKKAVQEIQALYELIYT